MPITSIPSYLTTADAFNEHWTLVESTTGSAFVLVGGQTLANLGTLRTTTADAITAIEDPSNLRAIASNDLLVKRAEMNSLITEFNRAVRYRFRGTNYVPALPRVPGSKSGSGVTIKAADDIANLWAKINANSPPVAGFTPPLLLGALNLAGFTLKVTALKTAFTTLTNRDLDLRLKREQRNLTLPPLRAIMVLYRQAVIATFGPGSALALSCPAVTPPPGSTPDAVHMGAAWNPTLGKAEIVWTVSSDPNLDEYEIRACDPPKYKGDDEEVVASIEPGTNEFQTDFGLLVSGAAKIFAVYVKTTTGNEKRSNTVKVTRP